MPPKKKNKKRAHAQKQPDLRRRGALKETYRKVDDDDESEEESEDECGPAEVDIFPTHKSAGFLADYIHRTAAQIAKFGHVAEERLSGAVSRLMDTEDAKSQIWSETLVVGIRQCLVGFWRQQDNACFQVSPRQVLLDVCKYLQSLKHESFCLDAEMEAFSQKYNSQWRIGKSHFESLAEREDHLEDFWENFKARPGTSWAGCPLVRAGAGCATALRSKISTPEPSFAIQPGQLYNRVYASRPVTAPSTPQGEPPTKRRPEFHRQFTRSPGPTEAELLEEEVGVDDLPIMDIALEQYMRMCHHTKTTPRPVAFVTGHSSRLDMANQDLIDKDLSCITALVHEVDLIEELDLSGNRKLTDKALVPLLRECAGNRSSLLLLNLSQCRAMGQATIALLTGLLSQASLSLLSGFDLSGVALSIDCVQPLLEAVGDHQEIQTLRLADVGLGRLGRCAKACISHMFKNEQLETVDLGWNHFDTAAFSQLGKCMAKAPKLKALSLPGCSAGARNVRDQPIEYFLEYLSQTKSLQSLDVAFNHIDFRGAFILEDVCEELTSLERLIISDNPLGLPGQRCILRLLSSQKSGLVMFSFDGCSASSAAFSGDSESLKTFNRTSPNGRYELDLARPYNRSVLRMLYKTCEQFKSKASDAFGHFHFTPQPYRQPEKTDGIWRVATGGKLSTSFRIDWTGKDAMERMSPWDFGAFLKMHAEHRRYAPDLRKSAALFTAWKQREGNVEEQEIFLTALSRDFLLSFAQVEVLARSTKMISTIMCTIMHCVVGGPPMRFRSLMLAASLGEYIKMVNKLHKFLRFNVENPTWHYRLDLASASERGVAEQLLVLNGWEVQVEQRLQRRDTSELGDRSRWRNVKIQGRPLATSVLTWHLPENDILEFDYSSGKRPSLRTCPLNTPTFAMIIRRLQNAQLDASVLLDALRPESHHMPLTAAQLRQLLAVFPEQSQRADCFMLLYFQVPDIQNEKLFRNMLQDQAEAENLRHRLGHVASFPFMQPEFTSWKLDFARLDQRIAAHMLFQLRAKERFENIEGATYVDTYGVRDELPAGVPRSWESLEKMPTSGIFTCRYVCQPGNRSFERRKEFLQKFGYWERDFAMRETSWCLSASDVNQDVLDFVEFLVGRFKDVHEAFTQLDGYGGNGELTMKEFVEGLEDLDFKEFDGPRKEERVQSLFHFLDANREGFVNLQKWQLFGELLDEMKLQIHDFASFAARHFDYALDSLEKAWKALDSDNSGNINADEWEGAIREKFRFFGPTTTLFRFMDKDGEGTVSFEEFEALEPMFQSYCDEALTRLTQKRGGLDATWQEKLARK